MKYLSKISLTALFLIFIATQLLIGCDGNNSEQMLVSSSTSGHFSIAAISPDMLKKLTGTSLIKDGPVKSSSLRVVNISYWDFSGKPRHNGQLIVNESVAKEVMEIFKGLWEMKFQLECVRPICEFDGDDDKSMANNNSSAFCAREITGKPGTWSKHSYGTAIDINPIQNPYVKGEKVLPAEGKAYTDRTRQKKGMLTEKAIKLFTDRGWEWGGNWNSLKDYQHFEKPQKKDI